MKDLDVDFDALDIVGSARGVELAPPASLPVDLDCRRVKSRVKSCEVSTDTYLSVKDTGVQTDVRYLTRDNVPIYCCGTSRVCLGRGMYLHLRWKGLCL